MSSTNWNAVYNRLSPDEWCKVRHGNGHKCSDWEDCHHDGVTVLKRSTFDKLDKYEPNCYTTPFTTLPVGYAGGVFVIIIKGRRYLVNTEGYTYCRYISLLRVID